MNMLKNMAIIPLSFALLATPLMADEAALYKKCGGCHGDNGEKAALGKSKIIKGMSEADLLAALKGYKDGSYGGPMKGLMKGQVARLSESDLQVLAKHIASF